MIDSAIPIKLNSRTFLRNTIPFAYPNGTRKGSDWETPGGTFDNTDPRNVIYWGPPRPVSGDLKYGLLPGESPENAIRRLKMDGYIGLYSARPNADASRVPQEKSLNPPGPTSLESLAEQAIAAREKREIRITKNAGEGTRRKTRAELKEDRLIEARAAALSGDTPTVPVMVGAGNGVDDFTRAGEPKTSEPSDEEEGETEDTNPPSVFSDHEMPEDFDPDEDDRPPAAEGQEPQESASQDEADPTAKPEGQEQPPQPTRRKTIAGGGARRANPPPQS